MRWRFHGLHHDTSVGNGLFSWSLGLSLSQTSTTLNRLLRMANKEKMAELTGGCLAWQSWKRTMYSCRHTEYTIQYRSTSTPILEVKLAKAKSYRTCKSPSLVIEPIPWIAKSPSLFRQRELISMGQTLSQQHRSWFLRGSNAAGHSPFNVCRCL